MAPTSPPPSFSTEVGSREQSISYPCVRIQREEREGGGGGVSLGSSKAIPRQMTCLGGGVSKYAGRYQKSYLCSEVSEVLWRLLIKNNKCYSLASITLPEAAASRMWVTVFRKCPTRFCPKLMLGPRGSFRCDGPRLVDQMI